jgi:hypothetical protein
LDVVGRGVTGGASHCWCFLHSLRTTASTCFDELDKPLASPSVFTRFAGGSLPSSRPSPAPPLPPDILSYYVAATAWLSVMIFFIKKRRKCEVFLQRHMMRVINFLVLVCSLSSHRHSHIHLIFSSRFIDS